MTHRKSIWCSTPGKRGNRPCGVLGRDLSLTGLCMTASCLISIQVTDQTVAEFIQRNGAGTRTFFADGTSWLELVFGWNISKFGLSLVLALAGLAMWPQRTSRPVGNLLLLVSLSHLTARALAGTLKSVFERPRPFEILESGGWDSQFFSADSKLSHPAKLSKMPQPLEATAFLSDAIFDHL